MPFSTLGGLTADCNLSVKTFPKLNPQTQPAKTSSQAKAAIQPIIEEKKKEEKKREEKKREETPPLRIKRVPTLEIDQIDKSKSRVEQKEKAPKVGKVSQRGKSKGKGADAA